MRQVVDWSAAVLAGIVAGTALLLFELFLLPRVVGGNPWVVVRLLASPLLGRDVLAPPATFDGAALAAGLLVHYALSLAFALVLALIVHRWGLAVGILGGAFFGLALYLVNFYTATLVFPWFFAMRSWTLLAGHVAFGALAGGVYEGLEVEEYVPE